MTTIACNQYGMAGDSQQTGHYVDRVDKVKIYKIRKSFVGAAGEASSCERFFEWFEIPPNKGAEFPNDLDENFCALQSKVDKCYYWDKSGIPVEVGHPAAIGTGAGFAMGAMLVGVSPAVAVRIAMELDPLTGRELYTIGEMKGYGEGIA